MLKGRPKQIKCVIKQHDTPAPVTHPHQLRLQLSRGRTSMSAAFPHIHFGVRLMVAEDPSLSLKDFLFNVSLTPYIL